MDWETKEQDLKRWKIIVQGAQNVQLWIARAIARVKTRPHETRRMDHILQLKIAAANLECGIINGTCPAPPRDMVVLTAETKFDGLGIPPPGEKPDE